MLIIIGIASGIIGLYIGRSSGTLHLRTTAKDIASTLRYARNHSVSEKINYCFVIETDKGKYTLYRGGDENAKAVISKPLPSGIELAFDDNSGDSYDIEFFPYGNSSGGEIELRPEKGRSMIVSVNSLSGRVEVTRDE